MHPPAGHVPVQSKVVGEPTTGLAGVTVNGAVGGEGGGGVFVTVHERDAGLASTLPCLSTAATQKVCAPTPTV